MKLIYLLLLAMPFAGSAQTKTKTKTKNGGEKIKIVTMDAAAGSYTISGSVTGYPDGTVVDLLNGYNGSPEASTQITNNRFSFAGKAEQPDLKAVSFNKQAPYIIFFLDNSQVKITGSKDTIEQARVTGSVANDQYIIFTGLTKPYQQLFVPDAQVDPQTGKNAAKVIEGFVKNYPGSHVAPLAILRQFQVSPDPVKMEELYNLLYPEVKATPISQYIAQQVAEAKKNPVGKILPDFIQDDTNGKAVSLSSLRGKYVLVDFWASWCGPCRQENPNVVSVYQKYKKKNFTVLGVSLDKSRQPWLDAIQADKLTWQHVSDLKGWQNAVAQQYEIYSIPQNFLLDPAGKVIAKNLRGSALEQALASLIK